MVYRAINGLIRHAIGADLITNDDIFVVRNQLMDILKLTDWNDKEPLTGNIEELLEPLIDYAVKAGIIEDTAVQRDLFDTRVMGVFTPMPREVNATFTKKIITASPSAATEWYYTF
ncbi:galactose-1-phosphate uridylyltransferase, partial [human gut metagenome]